MKNIFLLGLTSLFTDISSEMVYPLIGLYLATLNTPFTLIGLIEGIAESISYVLRVFSGRISDKVKTRKPLVIFGYTTSAIGKFFLYLSTSWLLVFFSRIIDRVGKSVRVAPRDALIAESSAGEKKGKIFGLHRTMDTFGAFCGVLIAYYFVSTSVNIGNVVLYKKVFLLSLIPALLGVITLFFVKEKREIVAIKEKKDNIFSGFAHIPNKAKLYILFSLIFALGNSSNQFLLLKSRTLGFSLSGIILLYLVYNISYTIFSFPAGIVSDKVGKKKVISLGYLIYSLTYLCFGLLNEGAKNFVYIIFIFYGIYMGLVEGQEKAFLSEIAPQEYKATILGLHSTLSGLMLFPASIIAGILWDILGSQAPFLFGSIMSFIATILVFFVL